MKRVIKIVFTVLCVILLSYIIVKKIYTTYEVKCADKAVSYSIKYKGLDKAVSFDKDENGDFYIAFKNRIQVIQANGKNFNVIKDNNADIMSIVYNKGKLYFSSKHSIYVYDVKDKTLKQLIKDIPNFGDYKNVIVKVNGDYLYASIGSVTNSGVVGNDNKWLSENPYGFDITPNTITLKGINFGDDKTGAFVPYKTSNINGQIIPNHFPGNSSIIIINTNTKAAETFAWGIRNVTGMDFSSDNKIVAAVGGMENRGVRPVRGDDDYIYTIEKGKWYGWPDYSGGDPVDSPKFKNKSKKILDKVPNINPPAPIYEYNSVGSLGTLSVDKFGALAIKNSIFIYDNKANNIININGNSINKYIELPTNKTYVQEIKIYNDGMYVLDSKEGCLLCFYKHGKNSLLAQDKNVLYYIVAAIGASVFVILIYGLKINSGRNKNE